MNSKSLLVTGSSGLIGSEVCTYFSAQGWMVHGVDNNSRAVFFGPSGDTRWNQKRLEEELSNFKHHELDIRDRAGVLKLIEELKTISHETNNNFNNDHKKRINCSAPVSYT
ncbi:MAG: GDP-mannose 4,6-dehydratase, partial [Fischerella sp.]|nr:GDP-mannose 4,6-dehydratase [Fischerella sp.]